MPVNRFRRDWTPAFVVGELVGFVPPAAGAGVAWLAGMGGAAIAGKASTTAVLLVLVPVWLLGLAAMGVLQWRVLRRRLPRSGRWVPVSSAAWLVGVLIPVAVISAVPDDWPTAAHIALAVLSAVAMGLVVGVVTGTTMQRLLERRAPDGAG